jgi:predicted nucleic acid-binding protein
LSNSPVCVDASFVVRLLQAQSDAEPAVRLYRSWMEDGRRLVAPTLLYYEVANALYRYAAHGYLRFEGVEALMEQSIPAGDCPLWRPGSPPPGDSDGP